MRAVLLLTAVVVAFLVGAAIMAPEGEVVTLTTRAANGNEYDTSLWIVEHDGTFYLRAGSPRARWLERLSTTPEVRVKRDGTASYYTAEPVHDPAVLAFVNEEMAKKYGSADRMIHRIFDRSKAVPIRLAPREPKPEEVARDHGPHP